jgi:hypothetical protein
MAWNFWHFSGQNGTKLANRRMFIEWGGLFGVNLLEFYLIHEWI